MRVSLLLVAFLLAACSTTTRKEVPTLAPLPTLMFGLSAEAALVTTEIPLSEQLTSGTSVTPDPLLTSQVVLETIYEGDIFDRSADTITTTAPYGGAPYKVIVNSITPIDARRLDRVLVVTAGAQGECHICRVGVDAAIFVKVNGQWQMESVAKHLTEMGSFGHLSPGYEIAIGPNLRAMVVQGTSSGQGYSAHTIALIGDVYGQPGVLLRMVDAEQFDGFWNGGPCSVDPRIPGCGWRFSSRLTLVSGSTQRDYFDLIVDREGIDRDGAEIDIHQRLIMTENGYR